MTEKFTLFYGGPASQWYASQFVIDNVTFNCAEQYMMFRKAQLFGDQAAIDIIMGTDNPKIQKAAGRTVKNFDPVVWDRERKLIVYRATAAKFSQNPKEMAWLLGTSGTTLVEASPWDTIWGIGLGANDPRCLDRSQWLGTNDLGEILTQYRNDFEATQWAQAGTDKMGRVKFIGGKMVKIGPDGLPA